MNSNILDLTCYRQDRTDKKPISLSIISTVYVRELRQAAEHNLEIFKPKEYRLTLERNRKQLRVLSENKTLSEEDIQNGDTLVFCRFENLEDSVFLSGDLVTYTLTLKIAGIYPDRQYSIHLNYQCENNPKSHYFNNTEINSRHKFEHFLKENVKKDVGRADIERMIEQWCDDISQGFRETLLKL